MKCVSLIAPAATGSTAGRNRACARRDGLRHRGSSHSQRGLWRRSGLHAAFAGRDGDRSQRNMNCGSRRDAGRLTGFCMAEPEQDHGVDRVDRRRSDTTGGRNRNGARLARARRQRRIRRSSGLAQCFKQECAGAGDLSPSRVPAGARNLPVRSSAIRCRRIARSKFPARAVTPTRPCGTPARGGRRRGRRRCRSRPSRSSSRCG